jgi:hypothetical protein
VDRLKVIISRTTEGARNIACTRKQDRPEKLWFRKIQERRKLDELVVGLYRIELPYNKVQKRALVEAVIDLRFP